MNNSDGKRIAIKTVYVTTKKMKNKKGALKQLDEVWAEVLILEKLNHPNIVQLIQTTWDFNSNPKRFDIILELVSGGSL